MCVCVCLDLWVRRDGHVALMGERRELYQYLVGKLEGKRPLWRHSLKWGDNIKINFQEMGCWGMESSSWLRLKTVVGHL